MRKLSINDWKMELEIYGKHERMGAFLEMYRASGFKIFTEREFFTLLGHIWTAPDCIWQYEGIFKNLLSPITNDEKIKKYLMEKSERAYFKALPDKFSVYRGYKIAKRKMGFSWTLSKKKAEWFAAVFNPNPLQQNFMGNPNLKTIPKVVSGTVKKKDALAYKNARREKEIIVAPQFVSINGVYEVNDKTCQSKF